MFLSYIFNEHKQSEWFSITVEGYGNTVFFFNRWTGFKKNKSDARNSLEVYETNKHGL